MSKSSWKKRRMFLVYLPRAALTYYCSFEPSEAAKARSLREGNLKAEDVIAIVRRRAETEQQVKYYIVDSVEALSKFATGGGGDVW